LANSIPGIRYQREGEGKGTHALPLDFNIGIHRKSLQHENPTFLLGAKRGHVPTGLIGHTPEQRAFFDLCAEEAATAGEPEEDEVEFGTREKLHGDVEEACVAGAEGEGFGGEAVFWDVREGGGEDCGLAVVVFVVWEAGVEG
jgi:hypothetical protein